MPLILLMEQTVSISSCAAVCGTFPICPVSSSFLVGVCVTSVFESQGDEHDQEPEQEPEGTADCDVKQEAV